MLKKALLLHLLVLFVSNAFSQKVPYLLLGKNEIYVRNYLDSIVNANKAYGIYKEEGKNDYGQISMGVYSEEDESVLDCLVIYCFFQKVGNNQVCIRQLIGGSPEYGEKHKAILSKDFKQLSKNKWSRPFNMGFSVLAEYVLEKETYYLTYNLVE
jgi:hypothetical protein